MTATSHPWGPMMDAAQRGDLPGLRFGCTPEAVAAAFGGWQPVYLATPYSRECVDDLGAWDYGRSMHMVRVAARAANDLRAVGVSAFSPIVLSGAMVHDTGVYAASDTSWGVKFAPSVDPLDDTAWSRWCQPFLNTCGAVVIPAIDGWQRSAGIWAELRYALDRQLPVFVYGGGV